MNTIITDYLTIALEAVRSASVLVKKIQRETVVQSLSKSDKSPVTVADFASQAVVAQTLQKLFPDCILVGEEDSYSLQLPENREVLESITQYVQTMIPGAEQTQVCRWIDAGSHQTADKFWTIDPIDGTKGFLRGDQYVVALAYIENGMVQLGVLGCPNLNIKGFPDYQGNGTLIYAFRGGGCWAVPISTEYELVPQQIYVSKNSESENLRLLRSFESGHTNADLTQEFMQKMEITTPPVPMDSQAKYAMLAAGNGEIILRFLSPSQIDYKEKIWDQAAGSIIIEEAGGQITDLTGKPLDFTTGRMLVNNTGILATNGLVHQQALEILGKLMP